MSVYSIIEYNSIGEFICTSADNQFSQMHKMYDFCFGTLDVFYVKDWWKDNVIAYVSAETNAKAIERYFIEKNKWQYKQLKTLLGQNEIRVISFNVETDSYKYKLPNTINVKNSRFIEFFTSQATLFYMPIGTSTFEIWVCEDSKFRISEIDFNKLKDILTQEKAN